MHHRIYKIFAVVAIMVLSASCLRAQTIDAEEIAGLSAALLKISATVHTAVRYKNPAPTLDDAELLAFSTAHQPKYLDRFNGYVLKARQEGKNSSVLVCDSEGKVALIEDAGCTSPSDWQGPHMGLACTYVLDLVETCPSN